MRVRKAKKTFEKKPTTQPKRNDLNTSQRQVLTAVQKAKTMLVDKFESSFSEITKVEKNKDDLYHPGEVAVNLGISPATVERYVYAYLRVIRRVDETGPEFRKRKNSFESEECPLDLSMKDGGPSYRYLSGRALLFLCAAITNKIRKDKSADNLRAVREVITSLGFSLGEKRKIGKHETQVVTFNRKDQ